MKSLIRKAWAREAALCDSSNPDDNNCIYVPLEQIASLAKGISSLKKEKVEKDPAPMSFFIEEMGRAVGAHANNNAFEEFNSAINKLAHNLFYVSYKTVEIEGQTQRVIGIPRDGLATLVSNPCLESAIDNLAGDAANRGLKAELAGFKSGLQDIARKNGIHIPDAALASKVDFAALPPIQHISYWDNNLIDDWQLIIAQRPKVEEKPVKPATLVVISVASLNMV